MPPRDPDGPPARVRAVTFNAWEGQPVRQLRANLSQLAEETGRPLVIALQEAGRLGGAIPGYRRCAADHISGDEATSSVLLVRNDVRVVREFTVAAGGPDWFGPKHGKRHDPRVYPGAVLEHDDLRWDCLVVHRTSLNWSPASWAAEDRALQVWFDRRARHVPNRPLVVLGDWNGRASDTRRLAVPDLARRVGARMVLRGIDGALLRNCQPVRGGVEKLPKKYGSDAHKPVVLTIRPT